MLPADPGRGEPRGALGRRCAPASIDVVVSDHSPCTPELKRLDAGDFGAAWGGIASLQLGLRAVWTGARERGVPLTDVVRWMATGTADLVGLRPARPGRLGASADLVAFAPEDTAVVDARTLAHRHPVTPYDGRTLAWRGPQGVARRAARCDESPPGTG